MSDATPQPAPEAPVALPEPTVGAGAGGATPAHLTPAEGTPVAVQRRTLLGRARGLSLSTLSVGLACCALESVAAAAGRGDASRLGPTRVTDHPAEANVLLVAGTVSLAMTPEVVRLHAQMPEPRYVVAFGACATSGGPYWDSYAVTNGVDTLLPVDVYVPGCPPRPEDLLRALDELEERIAGPAREGASAP